MLFAISLCIILAKISWFCVYCVPASIGHPDIISSKVSVRILHLRHLFHMMFVCFYNVFTTISRRYHLILNSHYKTLCFWLQFSSESLGFAHKD